MRLIVAMTGATGAVLGVRLLETLRTRPDIESHLVMSRWARSTIQTETGLSAAAAAKLADVVYKPDDLSAPIASGSFRTAGMVVVPCSMKTLAGIRTGYSSGLIGRAADVVLKERRRLVLVARETPLSEVHLENMLALRRMGADIVPPMPAFYNRPRTVDDLLDHLVARVLDQLALDMPARRWDGPPAPSRRRSPDGP